MTFLYIALASTIFLCIGSIIGALGGILWGQKLGRKSALLDKESTVQALTQQTDKNTKQQTEEMQSNLDLILNPLKEKLADFHKDVHAQNAEFKGRMEQFVSSQKDISSSAESLSRAMRGEVKSQGNWGEMLLEKILDSSGLRKGEEYILQGKGMGLHTEEGGLLKPDAVLLLPEKRCLLIDAKVSLKHYAEHEDAIKDNNPQQARQAQQAHAASVLAHVNSLSKRDYTQADLHTLDFVYMFMPNEGSFILAMQTEKNLFEQAWQKKVLLVSPLTLLSSLQVVASIWRLERQNKNAQAIATQAGALHDKFANFVTDINKIGESLQKASFAQAEALKKLSTGKGNLIGRAAKLKSLGAPTKKELDSPEGIDNHEGIDTPEDIDNPEKE